MKLAKVRLSNQEVQLAICDDDRLQLLDLTRNDSVNRLSDILYSPAPQDVAESLIGETIAASAASFLAPIDDQEVWAAGVTYKRSQVARMEESEAGASHYDQVYTAARPELFLKATPNRVSGPGDAVRVRSDSQWTVPEPEFTLAISPDLRLVGYTIGNDMSARDIEGENPLYLPQAKVYNQCCALGPSVLLVDEPLDKPNIRIVLTIENQGQQLFQGETNLGEMVRDFEELVRWVGHENSLPNGAFLLTGTGIVPPDELTLNDGDVVSIEITGIGTLTNPVAKAIA